MPLALSNIRSGPGSESGTAKMKKDKNFKNSENYDSEEVPCDKNGSGTLRTFSESVRFKEMQS